MAIKQKTTTTMLQMPTAPDTRSRDQIASDAVAATAKLSQPAMTTKPTSVVKTPAPSGPTATPNSLGLSFSPDPADQSIDAATRKLLSSYGTAMPNEQVTRSKVLSQFQGEIDALDRASAQARARLTASYAQTEKENTGQDAAIQARRGLLGSDFGAAQTERVVGEVRGNRDRSIGESDSAFATQKASLMTQARTMANDEYNRKVDAYRAGAGATVQYMKEKQVAAQNNAAKLAKQAYISGIDLTDPAHILEVKALAQQVGVTPETLIQTFQDYKVAQDAAKAEAQRKIDVEDRTYNLDVDKENNLNAREGAKLNFDIEKFNKTYALDSRKADAEIAKINNDIANGGANEHISDEFAAKYGLPLGLTKGQIAGFIPGQAEKVQVAQTEIDNRNEILNLINDLKTDQKGINAIGGTLGLNIPRNITGTAEYNYKIKFDKLKAALSLNDAGKLKGSGAISDAERQLLADAASALNINTTKDQFLQELDRIENKAREQAGRLDTFVKSTQANSLLQEFEDTQGGSEGPNPKAPASAPTSVAPSVSTKTLAAAIVPRYPQGTNLGNVNGQCVTFLHKVADFPHIGDGKNEKVASLDRLIKQGQGLPAKALPGNAKVGMILVSNDNKTYGHVAMINAISDDGQYARVTESNYKPGTVTHTRVVALNSPTLYGAIIPNGFKNIG